MIFTESSEATYYIVRSITGENLHTIEWNFEWNALSEIEVDDFLRAQIPRELNAGAEAQDAPI
jgi:hypothetical protein